MKGVLANKEIAIWAKGPTKGETNTTLGIIMEHPGYKQKGSQSDNHCPCMQGPNLFCLVAP